jgi:ATP-dependent DNA helicase RecG
MNLSDSVRFVKGVGPKKVALLAKLGIETIEELVYYKPRDWNFVPDITAIGDTKPDDKTMYLVQGVTADHTSFNAGKRRTCTLASGGDRMRLTLFNQPWFMFPCGYVYAYGKVTKYNGRKQMVNPHIYAAGSDLSDVAGSIYHATQDLSSHTIKGFIKTAMSLVTVPDILPKDISELSEYYALWQLHFPNDMDEVNQALLHFKKKELVLMQLALARRRHARKTSGGAKRCGMQAVSNRFAFALTASQIEAMIQISIDMDSGVPMNRLITGDVGSGKTAVAFFAMMNAVEAGGQALLIAPTKVLARQHYEDLCALVNPDKVGLVLAHDTGGAVTVAEEYIQTGEIQYIVGTTAVLSRKFDYEDLRLVVFDEQHKFGVNQRALPGYTPHMLTMTATPIPRSIMVGILGDMEWSHLEPWVEPDRTTMHTDSIGVLLDHLDDAQENNLQVFIVCSNIDDLSKWAYWLHSEGYNVVEAHGQMQRQHFDENMEIFRSGQADILICTTVIEVGIHVQNATLMIITDPDRFGLAQLHQLRGRVGRSGRHGVCLLYTSPEDISETAMERVKFFCSTDSGEEVAEYDMKMRGPGAIFGTEQHGLPDLKYADIISDFKLMADCKTMAESIVTADPEFKDPANMLLGLLLRQKVSDTDNFFAT